MRAKELFDRYIEVLVPIYGEIEGRSCAKLLLEDLHGVKYPDYDVVVEPFDFEQVIADIKSEKPIQQIVGKAYFYENIFDVTPHVLIPRGETEELIYWIIKDYKKLSPTVLDIGTGSGVIAISLALNIEKSKVTAYDISTEALAVACANSEKLGANVQFMEVDILSCGLDKKYDVVVSNPPYIARKEMPLMRNNVLDHEPHTALFVDDDDPLIFYRRVGELAYGNLICGGSLYFEINENYGAECCQLLSDIGFSNIVLRKDLNSKDRMIKAVK